MNSQLLKMLANWVWRCTPTSLGYPGSWGRRIVGLTSQGNKTLFQKEKKMPSNSTQAIQHNSPWLWLFLTFWAFLLSASAPSHFNPSPSHTEKNELTMSSPTRLAFLPLARPHFLYFCCLSRQLPIRFPEMYHGLSPNVRMLILQKQSWQLGRSCCQGAAGHTFHRRLSGDRRRCESCLDIPDWARQEQDPCTQGSDFLWLWHAFRSKVVRLGRLALYCSQISSANSSYWEMPENV